MLCLWGRIGFPVGSPIGTVQPFHDLFERTVFFGNSIVVGKPNDLGDLKSEILSKLLCEFHGGKGIGAAAVSNEFEVVRQLFQPLESHTHGKDAGTDATVVGHLVTDDGPAGGIHNEPDIGFDAAYFDVGFIGGKHFPFLVRILVHKRFDADSGGLAVVGDLLMGDLDVIEILERLAGFA